MRTHRVSGSIFWGLVFLAVGTLFLARNLGYPIEVWSGIVRYWPVVLIVWGLCKLIDYVREQEAGGKRSMFSASDVALIVLIIVFGSFMTLAANMSPNLSRLVQLGDFDIWDLTGNNFAYTEKLVESAPQGSTIDIVGRNGDIDVMPSDSDRITVDVSKTVRAADQAEADRLSPEFLYSIKKEGTNFRIESNYDHRFKASLVVHVPKRSAVSIENRHGRVTMKGLTGNQAIANRFGEIEVREITGVVKVENQNGAVRVNDVSDAVTISSSFAPITVANVRGDLKIIGRNDAVDIDHVEKDLDVESSFQNMEIRDPQGTVNVRNRNGEVVLRFKQAPTRNVTVANEFGGLTLELPAGSSFNADVHNRYGNIYSDFSELHLTSYNASHSMSGQVGTGGPAIRVDSRNGEIRFRRRG